MTTSDYIYQSLTNTLEFQIIDEEILCVPGIVAFKNK